MVQPPTEWNKLLRNFTKTYKNANFLPTDKVDLPQESFKLIKRYYWFLCVKITFYHVIT